MNRFNRIASKKYRLPLSRRGMFTVSAFLVMTLFIIYQFFLIYDLQAQIDAMQTNYAAVRSNDRISMLEAVGNNQIDVVKELKHDVWDLKMKVNDLNFRVMQNEWDITGKPSNQKK